MYNKNFRINKNFQTSVNIGLDLNNEVKINEYIPTSDICDLLKIYLGNIMSQNGDRATNLVGPYGKGKSFLILVLLYIISCDKNSKTYLDLVNKIEIIDEELAGMIRKYGDLNMKLMPVIINSTYNDLDQSFRLGLDSALRREGLQDIIPKTSFAVCLQLLEKWKSNSQLHRTISQQCIKKFKIDIGDLEIGLKNYNSISYKQFKELYNCINVGGLEFNPLVKDDICSIYEAVNVELRKRAFSGMFIVFDEFSKVIDTKENSLIRDIKLIQDISEKCSRTRAYEQMDICCVMHRSFGFYVQSKKNLFKTVAGRYKELTFRRSLNENYQIISSAIKKVAADHIIDDYLSMNDEFYSRILKSNILANENMKSILFRGCFPLNPLTTYALVQLSEAVAQNERTMFTFLSDSDSDSFNAFINNNSKGLFNVDKIYDYFEDTFKTDETDKIKNIYYKSQAALSRISDFRCKKIIKTIAVISMINDFSKLPPTHEIISLCLNEDDSIVLLDIENMLNQHLLRKNVLTNNLMLAGSNTKEIDEKIRELAQSKISNVSISSIANNINLSKYVLPREYNIKHSITRFYKVIFIEEKEFVSLTNFDLFFENNECDGIILYLLRKSISEGKIKTIVNNIGEQRIIVKYPTTEINEYFEEEVYKYNILLELSKQISNDKLMQNEIKSLGEETKTNISDLIEQMFGENAEFYYVNRKTKNDSFSKALSEIMEKYFNVDIIFNNELVNKRNVSAQYQKSENKVIDWLISGEPNNSFSDTSPETSIYNSIIQNNFNSRNERFKEMLEEIKMNIRESEKGKDKIVDILSIYQIRPYGIRRGVLPVIFGEAIKELGGSVILYYKDREIDLNGTNVSKAVINEDYFIKFSRRTNAQIDYVNQLICLFNKNSKNNYRSDVKYVAEILKNYFSGLPQIFRNCTIVNNYLNIDERVLKYSKLFYRFNINSYETIFDCAEEIFETNNYDSIYEVIKSFKENFEMLLNDYKISIAQKVKGLFNIDLNTSINMGTKDWLLKIVGEDYIPVLNIRDKELYGMIKAGLSFKNSDAVNQLSVGLHSNYIEDWKTDESEKLMNEINRFQKNIIESRKVEKAESMNRLIDNFKKLETSEMGLLLKNSIEDVFDQFGQSVSTEEKVSILTELLGKLI